MSWDISLLTEVDGHEIGIPGCDWNYTHNCNGMIREAGLGEWSSDIEGWDAATLGTRLGDALTVLREEPQRFEAMDPSNGWGSYETLVPVLEKIRAACAKYPSAKVYASF